MSVSVPYALANIFLLDAFGYPKALSFDFMELDPKASKNPFIRLPAKKLNDLFAEAAKALGDPYIALKVGDSFRISNYKETGKIYGLCKNMVEVIDLNARYQPIAVDIGNISTVKELNKINGKTSYFVDLKLFNDNIEDISHVFHLIFGAYATAFRWLTWGSGGDIIGLYTQLSEPPDLRAYQDIFRCPIYFNQTCNRIEFDEKSMESTFATHDPVRKSQYIAQLDALISSGDARESFLNSLRETIIRDLESGRSSLPLIADTLGITELSLKKSLKKQDIKYRDFIDNIRKELFIEKYESGMSFTDIAQALGYSDQPAFSKAFKRWYGLSPTQFKTKHQNLPAI